ncbi:hypothetical protein PPSIR1_38459 [Plesiocystis pacifica SIR-1]|uniref:Uncharacterized protein n=1 Tax=Plesiocystis pacifica SIR-1 TaxID=391625 RepID=A6G8L5_9BACT|nr:hypothetical protein PPSIR1_38459 [Plesiocystis pacifica SIR-1]
MRQGALNGSSHITQRPRTQEDSRMGICRKRSLPTRLGEHHRVANGERRGALEHIIIPQVIQYCALVLLRLVERALHVMPLALPPVELRPSMLHGVIHDLAGLDLQHKHATLRIYDHKVDLSVLEVVSPRVWVRADL